MTSVCERDKQLITCAGIVINHYPQLGRPCMDQRNKKSISCYSTRHSVRSNWIDLQHIYMDHFILSIQKSVARILVDLLISSSSDDRRPIASCDNLWHKTSKDRQRPDRQKLIKDYFVRRHRNMHTLDGSIILNVF